MPSNWLYIDTNFPAFTGEESTDEKVTTIQNYMFMLVEQLRYTLHNLDLSNMNNTAVERFTNYITEPVYGRIADAEGNITELGLTAQGLALRVSNAEGDITQLGITAQGLGVRISNAEGGITSLALTAQGLQTQVSDASGRISSLTQTVNGFTLTASNGSDFSYLYLTSNGINFGSAMISFQGMVTFDHLSQSGRTTINGGNITTGTISGVTLRSMAGQDSGFQVYNSWQLVGGIRYDSNGSGGPYEARDRMFIYTQPGWAMKLQGGTGISIEAPQLIYMAAGDIYLRGNVYVNNRLI